MTTAIRSSVPIEKSPDSEPTIAHVTVLKESHNNPIDARLFILVQSLFGCAGCVRVPSLLIG